jgi:hypothetical protein
MVKIGQNVSCNAGNDKTWFSKCIDIISYHGNSDFECQVIVQYYDLVKSGRRPKSKMDAFIGGNYYNLLQKIDMFPVSAICGKQDMAPVFTNLQLSKPTEIEQYRLFTRLFPKQNSLFTEINQKQKILPITHATKEDVQAIWDQRQAAPSSTVNRQPVVQDSDVEDFEYPGSDSEESSQDIVIMVEDMWT